MSSTGLIVIGTVAGALTANPALIASISVAGLALKTFSETKDYKRKIEMSKFAFSNYEKIRLDLRTAHWGSTVTVNLWIQLISVRLWAQDLPAYSRL